MLFRPEEVHGTSGTGHVLKPLPERYSHVANDIIGLCFQEDPIPNFNLNGLSTIEAGGIDPNRFAGKKPADRQRLKGSLAKPSLLALDGKPILSGKIVEGGKGDDIISPRE